jgi:hypothetical protein
LGILVFAGVFVSGLACAAGVVWLLMNFLGDTRPGAKY